MSFRNPRDTSKFGMVFDPEEGKTDQQFKNDCDINHIIAKFKQTGVLPDAKASIGQYIDITNVKTEYDDRVEFLRDVQGAFMEQPSDVRKQFKNDPALWLESVHDGLLAQEAQLNTSIAEPQKPPVGASAKADSETTAV